MMNENSICKEKPSTSSPSSRLFSSRKGP